jgi:adenylate cyclase
MKTILPILLLLTPLFIFAQSSEIEQLRKELETLDSIEFVNEAIRLSELFYKAEKYKGAKVAANHAFRKARQINNKEAMARALNREGKAMLKQQLKAKERSKIALKFRNSNIFLLQSDTTNKALEQDNLNQLKLMARSLKRVKDFDEVEEQIARLQTGPSRDVMKDTLKAIGDILKNVDPTKLNSRQRKALKKVHELYSEKEALNEQVSQLDQERQRIEAEAEQLNMEKEVLSQDILAKQEAISKMNEEQAKAELLNMQYKMLVDSLETEQMMDSLSIVQKDMKLEAQKALLEKQRARRWLYFAIIAIALMLAGGLFSRYKAQRKHNTELEEKNETIEIEKERSESLLLNILPEKIAKELKMNGKAKTRYHNNVSVLFTDFVNFSGISEMLSPEQLVEDLDHCFKNFDKIIEKYELEKIKTIGDAYMCAGGLTVEQPDHAQRVIKAAIEIQFFLQSLKKEKQAKKQPFFEARIGIHVGPIIAGVVGLKKFAYDIWGDTVNVASRMESSGEPGRVNISEDTYNQVKDDFAFEYRGKVEAKNKGKIDMYYVLESYN